MSLKRFIFILPLLGLASCSTVQPTTPICPPPTPVVCKPGSFEKTTLDTTIKTGGMRQYHVVALPSPVNSDANEQAVSFINDRSRIIALVTSDRDSGQHIYSARSRSTTSFETLRYISISNVPAPLGTPYYCSADGLIYFSAKANNNDPDDYDLYSGKATVENDAVTVSDVRPINTLNASGFFDSQPALDPSGKTIYFVSDRPGGNGGTDIWYSERNSINGAWSKPQPLPPPVNSPCDELSPFISPNDPGTLYFSSNGHETVGGYDLFKAKGVGSAFSEPENLGKPINTEYDETFPVALNDTAFFWSSNRPATQAGRNIWTVTRDFAPRFAGKQPILGKEDERLKPEDLHKEEEQVPVKEKEKKQLPDKKARAIDTPNIAVLRADTITLLINFPFDDFQHPDEFVLDKSGKPTSTRWRSVLDTIAKMAISRKDMLQELTIVGHTDSLGTTEYNASLGLRRAEFVASALQERGVPESLMKLRSKGSTQPVVHHESESDEVFRLRTRRVECIEVYK